MSSVTVALLYVDAIADGRRCGGDDGGGVCVTGWLMVGVEDIGYWRGEGAALMSLYGMLVSRRGVSSVSCACVREREVSERERERERVRERERERESKRDFKL